MMATNSWSLDRRIGRKKDDEVDRQPWARGVRRRINRQKEESLCKVKDPESKQYDKFWQKGGLTTKRRRNGGEEEKKAREAVDLLRAATQTLCAVTLQEYLRAMAGHRNE